MGLITEQAFNRCCEYHNVNPIGLLYAIPTRWNTGYAMIERILYLRKSIEQFLAERNKTYLFLEKKEWDHCGLLLTILLSFKKTSDRLQTTRRPTIDAVFGCYETLFNELDELDDIFTTRANRNRSWIQELKRAVDRMSAKLGKYYTKTDDIYIYGDDAILHPHNKTIFTQDSWLRINTFKDIMSDSSKIIVPYQIRVPPQNLRHIHPGMDRENIPGCQGTRDMRLWELWEPRAEQQRTQSDNQFDRYYNSLIIIHQNETALSGWKWNESNYRDLALIFHDIMAVPSTGAGIEREFSKSGGVVIWTRSRLNAETISEIMLFKNLLTRKDDAISEWDDAIVEIGIADEIVESMDIPKKWRKCGWNDNKIRWAWN